MSLTRRNRRSEIGTSNANQTAKAVDNQTKRGPSRSIRLARTLATGLPTEDDGWDREYDDRDPDPWDAIPEELDPGDPEEPVTDIDAAASLTPRAQRSRPIIMFSAFAGWDRRPDPLTARKVRRPTRSASKAQGMRIRIATIPGGSPDRDEIATNEAETELAAIADALAGLHRPAILATSRLDAYDRLGSTTQKALAVAAGCDGPTLSRHRQSLVECPWGLAPLQFFWWRGNPGLQVDESRQLVSILLDQPNISDSAVALQVCTILRLADPEEARLRTEAIRKQVPVARSILPHLNLLNNWSAVFPFVDEEEVEEQLGFALSSRGRGLVHLAILGCFAGKDPY